MQRIILHLDLDYFYAQVEETQNPDIKDKPIVVCQYSGRTDDSGAVATTNYIARKFNVKSGLPIKTAKNLLQNTDSVFISANHELYESISETIMNIIRKYSDKFEQLSIDEACIDISNKINNDYQDAIKYGNTLQDEIKNSEKLTCSIGIGPNKLIAKMAADSNKPNGTTVITPDNVEDFLFPQQVNKLYGIGPKTKSKLTAPVKNLKEIGLAVQSIKTSIQDENVEKTLENLQTFIDPAMCGEQMIEEFLEEHRDIRLYKVRLQDRGEDFLIDNKRKMLEFFDNIEIRVTKKLRTNITQN